MSLAGYASGNEFALRDGFQHCCLGNSTRALYYLWENIVESKGDEFRVNLLLNRASAWADVYSFIPYEGKVNVKMKKPCQRVLVRVPEWVESGTPQVVGKVNGSPRELAWEDRYVNFGAMKPGDIGRPGLSDYDADSSGNDRRCALHVGNQRQHCGLR